MYFPRLSSCLANRLEPHEIESLDTLLASIYSAGNSRFGEGFVARTLSLSTVDCRDVLLEAVGDGVLRFVYEVTCPHCGSAVLQLESLAQIPRVQTECPDFDCDQVFTPSEENVIVFYRVRETPAPKVLAPRWGLLTPS